MKLQWPRWILRTVFIFCIIACTKTKQDIPPAPQDFFQKKKLCSEYISAIETKLKDEDEENFKSVSEQFTHTSNLQGSYSTKSLDQVCYSSKYNTCVAFINTNEYSQKRRSDPVLESQGYEAIDLLTKQLIDFATQRYIQKAPQNRGYQTDKKRIRQEAGCVE